MTQDNAELEDRLYKLFTDEPYGKLNKCRCCGQSNYLCTCLDAMYFLLPHIQQEVDKASHSGLVRARVACSFNKDCLCCEANRLNLEYLIKPKQLKEGV